jgi:hypothetical protein
MKNLFTSIIKNTKSLALIDLVKHRVLMRSIIQDAIRPIERMIGPYLSSFVYAIRKNVPCNYFDYSC